MKKKTEFKDFKFVKEQLNGTIIFDDDTNSYRGNCRIRWIKGNKIFKHFVNDFIENGDAREFVKILKQKNKMSSDVEIEKIVIKNGEGVVRYGYEVYDYIRDTGLRQTWTETIKSNDLLNIFNEWSKDYNILIHKEYVPGSKYLPFQPEEEELPSDNKVCSGVQIYGNRYVYYSYTLPTTKK